MLRPLYYSCEQASQRISGDYPRHQSLEEVSAGAAVCKQCKSGGSWRLCSESGSRVWTILHSQNWQCRAYAGWGRWETRCTCKPSKFSVKHSHYIFRILTSRKCWSVLCPIWSKPLRRKDSRDGVAQSTKISQSQRPDGDIVFASVVFMFWSAQNQWDHKHGTTLALMLKSALRPQALRG